MLSQADNELVTRTGPGTPMGNLMRQYWIPALMSSEILADGDPMRVLLLGEKLIAFRDTNGNVGLVQNHCPHRGASLFFGRNEEAGLRCVYHGWKFDASGQCIDMPTEAIGNRQQATGTEDSALRTQDSALIKALAYPCVERGGVVWAYLGPRATPPPLPDIEANMRDDAIVSCIQQECNWLQISEGDIDTCHFGFLHRGSIDPDKMPAWTAKSEYYVMRDRAPHYKVVDVEAGAMYGAYVPAEPGFTNWRIALFLLPFYSRPPGGGPGVIARVPMDDDHTMVFRIGVRPAPGAFRIIPEDVANDPRWRRAKTSLLPNTTDWHGRWRSGSNMRNDFEVDRDVQRANQGNNGYTGVAGNMQDQMIVESMGPIYDRTHEHLGTSDMMIIRTRRRLVQAARALAEHGMAPPGVDNPEFYRMKSASAVLPNDADWIEATRERRLAFSA